MDECLVEVIDQVSLLPLLFSHDRVHLARLGACGRTPAQHPARAAEYNHGDIDKGTENFARKAQHVGTKTHLVLRARKGAACWPAMVVR